MPFTENSILGIASPSDLMPFPPDDKETLRCLSVSLNLIPPDSNLSCHGLRLCVVLLLQIQHYTKCDNNQIETQSENCDCVDVLYRS